MPSDHQHTHEGWFWFCPILATLDGEDGIDLEPRWRLLGPVFFVCEGLEALRIWVSSIMVPGYVPSFMVRIRERKYRK